MKNVKALSIPRSRGLYATVAAGLLLALAAVPIAAGAQTTGYLNGAPLDHVVPPPPSDPMLVEIDLTLVRAQHSAPGSTADDEAVGDAKAYFADALIVRFSEAARMPLSAQNRPILVHLLSRALKDAGDYAAAGKTKFPRPRPYVEDPGIVACNTDFLKPQESYPSGHSTNGYTAALILAEVMPDRRQALLARGIRYGNNRVVCGVHHPSDVLEGEVLATSYVRALEKDPQFRADLACARKEQDIAATGTGILPGACAVPHP